MLPHSFLFKKERRKICCTDMLIPWALMRQTATCTRWTSRPLYLRRQKNRRKSRRGSSTDSCFPLSRTARKWSLCLSHTRTAQFPATRKACRKLCRTVSLRSPRMSLSSLEEKFILLYRKACSKFLTSRLLISAVMRLKSRGRSFAQA